MIKIIKHGYKYLIYKTKCLYCDCEFTFQRNDLETMTEKGGTIKCPECKMRNSIRQLEKYEERK